jgi:hypothetical protein
MSPGVRLQVEPGDDLPIYRQIMRQVVAAIAGRRLAPVRAAVSPRVGLSTDGALGRVEAAHRLFAPSERARARLLRSFGLWLLPLVWVFAIQTGLVAASAVERVVRSSATARVIPIFNLTNDRCGIMSRL